MGSIADVFFGAHLDDGPLQVDAKRAGDKAGTTLGQRMSGALKKSSIGIADGLKIGAGISAFGALDTAISSTIGFFGDAVRAAREDQESISRLGAALKANIPAWDGNTKAIEATILARQQLGFTDEEQRKSLALLVAATHDVNKALDINRTAMDLARLKGISLEEASSALVKVEGGQYRALKALGIVLKAGATQTEALAAVQKVAAGQADAFANTNEGKLLVSQIKVGEAMERIGYKIMPAFTEAMVAAADAITVVADTFGPLFDAGTHVADGLGFIVKKLQDINNLGRPKEISKDFDKVRHTFEVTGTGARKMADDLAGVARRPVVAFAKLTDASRNARDALKQHADAIKTAIHNLTTKLVAEAQAMIDGYYDPIIEQDQLRVDKDTVNADTIARNATKAGTAERHQADLTLANSQKNLDQTRLNLLASGQLTAKDQKAWLTDLQKKYKTATGAAKADIQSLIDKIHALQNVNAGHITIRVSATGRGPTPTASGGPRTAGQLLLVGEQGPELWAPQTNGTMLTAAQTAQAMGGDSVGDTYNIRNEVKVEGTIPYDDPLTIAWQLQRFSANGVLNPRKAS